MTNKLVRSIFEKLIEPKIRILKMKESQRQKQKLKASVILLETKCHCESLTGKKRLIQQRQH